MSEGRGMPRYKCHKEVWALKIAKMEPSCGDRPCGENERLMQALIPVEDVP